MKDDAEIDLNELLFLTTHIAEYYEREKETLKKKDPNYNADSLYMLVSIKIISEYRQTSEIVLTNGTLLLYQEIVKAIVNNDGEFIYNLIDAMEKERQENEN